MILVTGATGYIGCPLVQQLVKDGHKVRAMVVDEDPHIDRLEGIKCEIVKGDITRKETLKAAFKGIKTVIHLAAVKVSLNPDLIRRINYDGAKNVVDTAVDEKVNHFIYLSAAAANYQECTAYGKTKKAAEALMQAGGRTKFTIIRPTLLYGGGGSEELIIYLKSLKKFSAIAPTVGSLSARKRPVWLGDIVNGLSLVVNKPVSYGKTYNFSGATDVSMWEYTQLILHTFGVTKPMVPVPLWLCRFIALVLERFSRKPFLRKDLILGVTMDAIGSYEEAKADIGYDPVDLYGHFRDSFTDEEYERLKS